MANAAAFHPPATRFDRSLRHDDSRWIAVSQIRRSVGNLHGMWLAVTDGLLFPLLLMAGLIGWFWHWVFHDLIRTAIIAGEPELSTLERLSRSFRHDISHSARSPR